MAETPLAAARDAFDHHRWRQAYDRLSAADSEHGLEAEDLERLGEAARWSAEFDEMLDAFERAGSRYQREGDNRGAARVALKLVSEHGQRGNDALAAGFFARAASLLKDEGDSRERGLLLWTEARLKFDMGEIEEARDLLTRAVELAERTGDPELGCLARSDLGQVLLLEGQIGAGMSLVDEAAAAVLGGELEPWTSGMVFCGTIFACRNSGDWRRAGEWSEASLRWCERHSLTFFPGLCRFHLAEVLRLQGKLDEAEKAAAEATREMMVAAPRIAVVGHTEVGEVRRRRGDLEGAAAAFACATEIGWDPQPGLSLLRLDQGKPEAARHMIADAIEVKSGLPRAGLVHVLPAAVEIGVAAEDLPFARHALGELEKLAEAYEAAAISASAAVGRGRLALAESRHQDAVRELRRGRELWTEVNAPYEAAEARTLLARAYRTLGDDDSTETELTAARTTFRRIGAELAAKRADEALAGGHRPRLRVQTFMFTDIVDSTKLVELLGDDAWESLLTWHDRTLRAAFESHGGTEVKHEGDGFFISFDDAASAIECAIAIQRALVEHRREHGFAPSVRAGIHTGEALDRGGDWGGSGVHAAARVAAAASAGEVIASRAAIDAAGDGFVVLDQREIAAKGFSKPIPVASIGWQ